MTGLGLTLIEKSTGEPVQNSVLGVTLYITVSGVLHEFKSCSDGIVLPKYVALEPSYSRSQVKLVSPGIVELKGTSSFKPPEQIGSNMKSVLDISGISFILSKKSSLFVSSQSPLTETVIK